MQEIYTTKARAEESATENKYSRSMVECGNNDQGQKIFNLLERTGLDR